MLFDLSCSWQLSNQKIMHLWQTFIMKKIDSHKLPRVLQL
jgi:hypothetical protein